jgi:hypothetical protein
VELEAEALGWGKQLKSRDMSSFCLVVVVMLIERDGIVFN